MSAKRVLLVTATAFEVQPILAHLGYNQPGAQGLGNPGSCIECQGFDCLVTGVGQLQCAAHLMSLLSNKRYDRVVQAGLAGSFSPSFPKCAVVQVVEEALGDCGAEADGSFLDLGDMGLLPKDQFPFSQGLLKAPSPAPWCDCDLPTVRSVTVNRTLGSLASINWVKQRFAPDVVNMEGAALFYVCLLKGIPFVELRAVSDMVGPRDKSAWDIPGSISALAPKVIQVLRSAGD